MIHRRILFCVAAVLATGLAMSFGAAGAQAQGTWVKDQNGCNVWHSDPKPGDTITWSGGCVKGYAEGVGTMKGFHGGHLVVTYTGQVKDGEMNGQGTLTDEAGNIYTGAFIDGDPHGQGTFIEKGGNTYTGGFKLGKKQGQGTETAPNGNKFTGEFRDSKMWNGTAVVKADGQRVQITNGKLPNGKSANE